MMTIDLSELSENERIKLKARVEREKRRRQALSSIWKPQEGRQTAGYYSPAQYLFYGGQAGGGKTELEIGLALTQHYRSIILRREFPQAAYMIERIQAIVGDIAQMTFGGVLRGFPGGRTIQIGSIPHEKNLGRFKGRPHDLICFDEGADFTEKMFMFVTGWLRTTRPGQRTRVVIASNPPTSVEGEWVIHYWRPWIDSQYTGTVALPEELRWFARIDGEDVEVEDYRPIKHRDEVIMPVSRTFIPASLSDNPLVDPNYRNILQALSEPLRSQLLYGDFTIGVGGDPWALIPRDWVAAANERWRNADPPPSDAILSALGVDVARGGVDKTVLARLYDLYFPPLLKYSGAETRNGTAVVNKIQPLLRPKLPICIDVTGIGSSPYDLLIQQGVKNVTGINFAASTEGRDRTGYLGFVNVRAEMYWLLREALDPEHGLAIALPPDPDLTTELCAHKWMLTPRGVQIEKKEDVIKRINRSPDSADAVVLAWYAVARAARRWAENW